MKKLINEVDNVVTEMLDGMVAAYPQYVKRLEGLEVLVRAGGSDGKVGQHCRAAYNGHRSAGCPCRCGWRDP